MSPFKCGAFEECADSNRRDYSRRRAANGFFWSGNFVMSLGATLAAGGCLVLQPTFVAADALELMAAERSELSVRLAAPVGTGRGRTELAQALYLSSMRFADVKTPIARHPTVSTEWYLPDHAYGNTETFTISTIFPL